MINQNEIDYQVRVICEGFSNRLNMTQISSRYNMSLDTIWRWIEKRERFLLVSELTGVKRVLERKRRADVFLRTGVRIQSVNESPPVGFDKGQCTRVTGRTDGVTQFCGKPTKRNLCMDCEIDLNYTHLDREDAERVVSLSRF